MSGASKVAVNVLIMRFEELYSKLNIDQKEAVDAIEGPVIVVAGPGTGKTQILTLRIANILRRTDVSPRNILALTFTESGVASMRRRLASIMGAPAYSVAINTFHGFCNEIIKTYPEEFSNIIGAAHISEVEQFELMENLIESAELNELRPFGDTMYYLHAIVSSIDELKREGIAPHKFQEFVLSKKKDFDLIPDLYYESGAHKGKMKGGYQKLQKQIKKNIELALIYSLYQEKLKEKKSYDYSDMIMEVLSALSSRGDLLLSLQEEYQYILVDEHQDTNNAQNKILEFLNNFHESPNLFVVGDDKQAIYRFQGASLENFLYFKKLYPQAKLITLRDNYRSTQTILDSAHGVLASQTSLRSCALDSGKKIKIFEFSAAEAEEYFVAKDIAEKIAGGVFPHEISVLYRDNRDAAPLASMLEKMGVPYSIASQADALQDEDIRKLLKIFRAIYNFGSPEHLFEALHADFLKIDPLDIYQVTDYANRNHVSIFVLLRGRSALQNLSLASSAELFGFYEKLSRWASAAKNLDLLSIFLHVTRESGFLAHILNSPTAPLKLEKLTAIFDEARDLVARRSTATFFDFVDYVDALLRHKVAIKRGNSLNFEGRVRLMTAHKSKGMEFAHVYIVSAHDGHWGGRRRTEKLPLMREVFTLSGKKLEAEEDGDERRLFYVALTRAKESVTITYAKTGEAGRAQIPAQFVALIPESFKEAGDVSKYETEFAANREIVFGESKVSGARLNDKEFVQELWEHNGLSVTALNNYLECPWKYFYTNLLRIPKAPSKHQMYGIAVHAALKDFFDILKERAADKDFLLGKFEYYLKLQPLKEDDFKAAITKGKSALAGYFDFYKNSWRYPVITEFNIPAVMLSDDIRLTGKIDKIEIVGEGGAVNVVDYKTGAPKTMGEIQGTTLNGNGNMKRQLVFYNLLLNKYEGGKYKMDSGEIDFVEPDPRGRYHKEKLVIQSEEIAELESLITKTASEILALEFWNKKCGEIDCEFCQLRFV